MQADFGEDDPQAMADALELLEAFQKFRDPGVRRSLISLAHAMRPAEPGNHAVSDTAALRTMPTQSHLRVKCSPWLYALLLLAAIAASAIVWEVFDPVPIGAAASAICRNGQR